jgi:hypothetical protein
VFRPGDLRDGSADDVLSPPPEELLIGAVHAPIRLILVDIRDQSRYAVGQQFQLGLFAFQFHLRAPARGHVV